MVWQCACVDRMSLKCALCWHIQISVHSNFHALQGTHTHTHTLIPFEDCKPLRTHALRSVRVPNDSHTLTGFALTVISSISPVKTQDQHIPSAYNTENKINNQKKNIYKKSTIGCRFVWPVLKKITRTKCSTERETRERERQTERVCCVCVLDREVSRVFASRDLAAVLTL